MKNERIVSIVLLVISVILYVNSLSLPVKNYDPLGTSFFPKVLSILLAVLSIAIFVKSMLTKGPEKETTREQSIGEKLNNKKLINVLFLGGSFIIYSLLINYLGYIFSTILFLIITIGGLSFNKKGFIQAAVFSVAITYSIYYVFRIFLNLMLPEGRF